MRPLWAIVIGLALSAVALAQQPQARDNLFASARGTGVIEGTVVSDAQPPAPLRRATVTLTRSGLEDLRTTSTDDQGHYAFSNLPAGTYLVGMSKGAYIPANYGASQPGLPGRPITLADKQRITVTPVALIRGAVIAGRIVDRSSRPMSSISVSASQFVTINGERRPRNMRGASGSAVTNGHGDYRIYGLLPGEYIVSANPGTGPMRDVTAAELAWTQQPTGPAPPQGRPFTYARLIYPGTADPGGGTPIRLGKNEERLGVDFAIAYLPVARVTGSVVDADGHPAPGMTVLLVMQGALSGQLLNATRTASDGSFVFPGVAPGDIVLSVRGALLQPGGPARPASQKPPPPLWGSAELRVIGDDVHDVVVRLQPGIAVSGQVAFRASPTLPPDPTAILVRLIAQDASVSPLAGQFAAPVSADGTFRVEGVPPGAYRFLASTSNNQWTLKSAMVGGRDTTDLPFSVRPGEEVAGVVLTMSDAQTTLSVKLVDAAGRPAPPYSVLTFAVDRTYWTDGSRRIALAKTNEDGAYVIAGLPPGEYYVCALAEFDPTSQFDPGYLEQMIPAALKLTLGEGEKRTQTLRVGG